MMFLTPGTSCSAWRGCERRTMAPQAMSTLRRPDRAEGGVRRPLDLVLERTGRRRQLDGHRQGRAVDDDVLDHVEGDEVAPELGLLDGAHRIDDGVVGEDGHRRSGPFGLVGTEVGCSDGRSVDIVPRPRGGRGRANADPHDSADFVILPESDAANLAPARGRADASRVLDTTGSPTYPRPRPSRAPRMPVPLQRRPQRTWPLSTSSSWMWSRCSARRWPSTTSTSRSSTGSSSASSVRRAAARRRRCG